MTLQTASVKIPHSKSPVDLNCNKRIADGAGLSLVVLPPTTTNHLTFQIVMNFRGGREVILFEKTSIEIDRGWTRSKQLQDATKEMFRGDFTHVGIIQSFLLDSLEFYVEPQGNGDIDFTLAYRSDLGMTQKDRHTKKHRNDVLGWLVAKLD